MSATISSHIKASKNKLQSSTYNKNVELFITTHCEAVEKFKIDDFLYIEIKPSMSFVIKMKKILNLNGKLAFEYTYMINRFNKINKDCWCFADCVRLATENEKNLLNKHIKQ